MRILVISDIHADITAFEAVLKDAEGDWDYVWCLGDIVGFGPDPNECVEKLKTMPHLCLAGHVDWTVLGRLDMRVFNPAARHVVEWTQDILESENLDYLENLPVKLVIGDYTLVHGSPREPVYEFILESLVATLNFPHLDTTYCLFGNTRTPAIFTMPDDNTDVQHKHPDYRKPHHLNGLRQMINPGSVTRKPWYYPDAHYGILDLSTDSFEHRSVPYDMQAVQERMREYDFPESFIQRWSY